jgi:hypothetical protein
MQAHCRRPRPGQQAELPPGGHDAGKNGCSWGRPHSGRVPATFRRASHCQNLSQTKIRPHLHIMQRCGHCRGEASSYFRGEATTQHTLGIVPSIGGDAPLPSMSVGRLHRLLRSEEFPPGPFLRRCSGPRWHLSGHIIRSAPIFVKHRLHYCPAGCPGCWAILGLVCRSQPPRVRPSAMQKGPIGLRTGNWTLWRADRIDESAAGV